MNSLILNTEVQEFINTHLNDDTHRLLLGREVFKGISNQELVEQIESKRKTKNKLPNWFSGDNIYYPKKLNLEQTSSETTAAFKSELPVLRGNRLADLTGGLGIDSYYFSKQFNEVTHFEINTDLSEIALHNFKQLGCDNINCMAQDGIDYLKATSETFDVIYVDPSRRNDAKGKVVLLSDCAPDVSQEIDFLLSKARQVVIKTSPLLDISNGIRELNSVKEIHVIAVNNEAKELLFIAEANYSGAIQVVTTNLKKTDTEEFKFIWGEKTTRRYSLPLNYLYEPNVAIMKSGAFHQVTKAFTVQKLQEHSHLYTSETRFAEGTY